MAKTRIFHRQTTPGASPPGMGALANLTGVRLRRVDILLTAGFAREEDIPPRVISCLGLIVGNPGISQNGLAQTLGVNKSAIVSLMHELERRGWAVRTQAADDRRRHELHATMQGRAELEKISSHVKAFEDKMLADIPVEDLRYLHDLLDKMHASCIRNLRQGEARYTED